MLIVAVTACGTGSTPNGSATPSHSRSARPSASGSPITAPTDGSWRIVQSPSPSNDNYLSGVACTSSDNCWAVGYYNADKGAGSETLVEHWNGMSWKVVSAPDPRKPGDSLDAIACVSALDCWAVGSGAGTSSYDETVIEHWDGVAWSAVAAPNTEDGGVLYAVTCVAASDCWAVGYHARAAWLESGTLIEHWDGVSWRVVGSGTQDWYSGFNELSSVACVSASDCWAVGEIEDVKYPTSVMERWNGTRWSVAKIEPRETAGSDLNDLSCISSDDCWAVGGTLGEQVGYFDRWNGTSWTMVAEPALPGQEAQLETLRCLSADACWAVGVSELLAPGFHPYPMLIAVVWNGESWSHEPIVMPITPRDTVGGGPGVGIVRIACVSPSFCVGVGSRPQPNGNYANTLIEELS